MDDKADPVAHAQMADAAEGMGGWLEAAPWDLLVHATYRRPASPDTAMRRWRAYADRRLGRSWGRPIAWVAVTEPSGSGRHHVHALLVPGDGTRLENPKLQARRIAEDWRKRHGHVRVEPYDPSCAGACYVAKQYGRPGRAFDASRSGWQHLGRYRSGTMNGRRGG